MTDTATKKEAHQVGPGGRVTNNASGIFVCPHCTTTADETQPDFDPALSLALDAAQAEADQAELERLQARLTRHQAGLVEYQAGRRRDAALARLHFLETQVPAEGPKGTDHGYQL